MGQRHGLGEFELLVLAALLRLGADAYGTAVYRELEARTGRTFSMGAVYTTLYRLEEKGLTKSSHGDPTPVRGGRAKRVFRITPRGMAALKESVSALETLLADTALGWT